MATAGGEFSMLRGQRLSSQMTEGRRSSQGEASWAEMNAWGAIDPVDTLEQSRETRDGFKQTSNSKEETTDWKKEGRRRR